MSTLRISNIEAKSVPASATIDEKVKITNSSGDTLVFIDGKTSGITTVGINTTDSNITFDANSNIVVTGIITATRFSGQITPTSLEIGSNIKLGNAGVITATSFVGSGANLTSLPTQVTINTNADNRVITGGSGVNLYGESGLTYDGSDLNISNNVPQLLLTDTNSNNSYGRVRGNGGNLILSADVNNASGTSVVVFEIDGGEKARIDNYGTLRIGNVVTTEGTSSNTKRIALGAKGSIWGWTSGNINGALTLSDNYYWDGSNNKAIESDYCAYLSLRSGSMRFGCTAASQTGGNNVSGGIHEKVRFENDGNVSIADGNLSFASGHGIDFSADANGGMTNSEVLDDYEEGYYYPAAQGTSSTTSAYYYTGENKLGYVKIGKLVTIMGRLRLQADNYGGGLRMTLPYAAVQGSNTSNSQMAAVATHGVNFATASGNGHDMGLFIEIFPNTSYADFIISKDNQGWIQATNSNIQANNYLAFNLSYVTSD